MLTTRVLRVSELPQVVKEQMLERLAQLPSSILPGCDGMTVDDALNIYMDFAGRGLVPSLERLCMFTDIVKDVDQKYFENVVIPLRQITTIVPGSLTPRRR